MPLTNGDVLAWNSSMVHLVLSSRLALGVRTVCAWSKQHRTTRNAASSTGCTGHFRRFVIESALFGGESQCVSVKVGLVTYSVWVVGATLNACFGESARCGPVSPMLAL